MSRNSEATMENKLLLYKAPLKPIHTYGMVVKRHKWFQQLRYVPNQIIHKIIQAAAVKEEVAMGYESVLLHFEELFLILYIL